jgi:hypothetical protein
MSDDIAERLAGMLDSVIHMIATSSAKLLEIEGKLNNILAAFPAPEDGGLAGHLLDHTTRRNRSRTMMKIIIGLSISLGSVICLALWEIAKAHIHG